MIYNSIIASLTNHIVPNTAPFLTIPKRFESGDDALSMRFCTVKNGAALRKMGLNELVTTRMKIINFSGVITNNLVDILQLCPVEIFNFIGATVLKEIPVTGNYGPAFAGFDFLHLNNAG